MKTASTWAGPPESVLQTPSTNTRAIVARGERVSTGDLPDTQEAFQHRKWFNLAWRDYLHANFGSIAVVARTFHVDERTARDWWNGRCAPSGCFVAFAFQITPREAAARLLHGGWLRSWWIAVIAAHTASGWRGACAPALAW